MESLQTKPIGQYLSEVHDQVKELFIDQAFIDHRDSMKDRFRASGRDDNTRLMHADCLAVEYNLLDKGLVSEPTSIFHDFIYEGAKVDCKIVTSKYFNVPDDKVIYYMKNIRANDLTHFAFYKWDKHPDRPLQVGDVVSFKLCEVVDAERVMNKVEVSSYGGYYYRVKNI